VGLRGLRPADVVFLKLIEHAEIVRAALTHPHTPSCRPPRRHPIALPLVDPVVLNGAARCVEAPLDPGSKPGMTEFGIKRGGLNGVIVGISVQCPSNLAISGNRLATAHPVEPAPRIDINQ
jgi:hypothetical protein